MYAEFEGTAKPREEEEEEKWRNLAALQTSGQQFGCWNASSPWRVAYRPGWKRRRDTIRLFSPNTQSSPSSLRGHSDAGMDGCMNIELNSKLCRVQLDTCMIMQFYNNDDISTNSKQISKTQLCDMTLYYFVIIIQQIISVTTLGIHVCSFMCIVSNTS